MLSVIVNPPWWTWWRPLGLDFSLADLHFPSIFTEISSFFPRLTVTPPPEITIVESEKEKLVLFSQRYRGFIRDTAKRFAIWNNLRKLKNLQHWIAQTRHSCQRSFWKKNKLKKQQPTTLHTDWCLISKRIRQTFTCSLIVCCCSCLLVDEFFFVSF